MARYYDQVQPFKIKGDVDHALWTDPLWKDRIVYDGEGNILRGRDLEEYYWKLRRSIGYHPLFGRKQ